MTCEVCLQAQKQLAANAARAKELEQRQQQAQTEAAHGELTAQAEEVSHCLLLDIIASHACAALPVCMTQPGGLNITFLACCKPKLGLHVDSMPCLLVLFLLLPS